MNDNRQEAIATEAASGRRVALTDCKVGMGEIEVGSGQSVLKTLLGSCIGLVLHDRRARVGGLAHIVLPQSSGQAAPLGKFADTAVPELMRLIEKLGGRPRHIVAKFAGGSNMFSTTMANPIGDKNHAAIEATLKSLGIPIVGRHCGGNLGRRMTFFVETGRVTIDILGNPTVEL